MILDDIEFDALSRADTLLLALLRPRLWSEYLNADALGNAELRDRLQRETARRAAQTANERARLAFEQTEAAPFPDFARQARLAEFDHELALERVRLNWLDCAQTAEGIEQLNRIENLPLRTNNAHVRAQSGVGQNQLRSGARVLRRNSCARRSRRVRRRLPATRTRHMERHACAYDDSLRERGRFARRSGRRTRPHQRSARAAAQLRVGAPHFALGRRVTPRVWATSVVPDVARLRRDARRRGRAVAVNVSGRAGDIKRRWRRSKVWRHQAKTRRRVRRARGEACGELCRFWCRVTPILYE